MSIPSRLVVASRATGRTVPRYVSWGRRSAYIGAAAAEQDVTSVKVWQVGEAGPSTWTKRFELTQDVVSEVREVCEPAPAVRACMAPVPVRADSSAKKMRSHLKRPRDFPAEARDLLETLSSGGRPSPAAVRASVRRLKQPYHKSYMLAEIGRYLSKRLRVYASDTAPSTKPPWDDYGRALFSLLLPSGAKDEKLVPQWHDQHGRMLSHHPVTALLGSISRQFRHKPGDCPDAVKNATILLDTIRQIPSTCHLAPDALVAVLHLVPSSGEYHSVKAHLLTSLLVALDRASTPASSTEPVVLLQKAIKDCTPTAEWKAVPDSLHQALLLAWKSVINHTVTQPGAEVDRPEWLSEHFTPAFLSLLLKLPGTEGMSLPELLEAMRTLDLAITPFQTQLVLRYDSLLAPWLRRHGNESEVLDKAWQGLSLRRKLQGAVGVHDSGPKQQLRSLELAWGEVVLSSYETVRSLMNHEVAARHPGAENEMAFWAEQVVEYQQRWREMINDSGSAQNLDDFAPYNMQGQAIWLLLRFRLLEGNSQPADPLDDPRHLFQLSIGTGPRTPMQHIRIVSCLIRLFLHHRSDITQFTPYLDDVAAKPSIKLPALLLQRVLLACNSPRHIRAILPALLALPSPDEAVSLRKQDIARLVPLAADCHDGLDQLLALLDRWRVRVQAGQVLRILQTHAAGSSEVLQQVAAWETSRE